MLMMLLLQEMLAVMMMAMITATIGPAMLKSNQHHQHIPVFYSVKAVDFPNVN